MAVLDSAACNKIIRKQFLQLLRSPVCNFDGLDNKVAVGTIYLVWLSLRDISVSCLRVCDSTNSAKVLLNDVPLSKASSIKIEAVKLDEASQLKNVAARCISLENFVLKAPFDNVDAVVTAFLQHCPKLKSLSIDSWCHFMDNVREEYMVVKTYGIFSSISCIALNSILEFGVNLVELNICDQEKLIITQSELSISSDSVGLPNLTHLNTCNCNAFTDETMRIIAGKCHKLEYFGISLCPRVTDTTMVFVTANNHGLRIVNLVLSGVHDIGVLSLGEHCPDLETLNVNALPLSETTVVTVIEKCRKMTSLKIKHIENINDAVFEAIALHQPNFKAVYCGRISADVQVDNLFMPSVIATSLCSMINNCSQLTVLDMSDCNDIDSVVSLAGVKLGHQLKSLAFSAGGNVTEETMLTLAHQCSELTFLEAQGGVCMTDSTVSSLVTHNEKLKIIMLGKTAITDISVMKIAECCPHLTMLIVSDCPAITTQAVVEVIVQCPTLVTLHCFGVSHSTLILHAMIQNSPFISDVGLSEDTAVSQYSFQHVTCKAFAQAFPRAKLCCMRTVTMPVPIM